MKISFSCPSLKTVSVFLPLVYAVLHPSLGIAAAPKCEQLLSPSLAQISQAGLSFNIFPSPALREIEALVQESRPELNHQPSQREAKSLERMVREQTGLTISLLNREFLKELNAVPSEFAQLGFVVGDPHDGNFGFRLNFHPSGRVRDHFDYGLKDFDEAGIGNFIIDFSRYLVYIKAAHKNLERFGAQFLEEVFSSYIHGLEQKSATTVPNRVRAELVKSEALVRQKIQNYAIERTNENHEFKNELHRENIVSEFRFRNLERSILSAFGVSQDEEVSQRRKEAVETKIEDEIYKALENHFQNKAQGEENIVSNISLFDLAIIKRDSGGSEGLQRFWISARVKDKHKNWLPVIIELKQNSVESGWTEAIRNSLRNDSQRRYRLSMDSVYSQRGHAQSVVQIGGIDFILRIKGTPDVKTSNKQEEREIILYNAYLMGLMHGAQGDTVSAPYTQALQQNPDAFRTTVLGLVERVVRRMTRMIENQ